MLGLLVKLLFLGVVLINMLSEEKPVKESENFEQLTVQWAAKEYPIMPDKPSVLHFIIYTDDGVWIDDAEVTGELQSEMENKEVLFYHVEDGLYETVVSFPSSGNWEGELKIQRGDSSVTTKSVNFYVSMN